MDPFLSRDAGVYYESLAVQDHGFALWTPGPDGGASTAHQEEGIQVGDVGSITRDGAFDFWFNISREPNDPIHLEPPPFDRPFRLNVRQGQEFSPPTSLLSTTVRKTDLAVVASASADLSKISLMRSAEPLNSESARASHSFSWPADITTGASSGGSLAFTWSGAANGALLVLPQGALRMEQRSKVKALGSYIAEHAERWWTYVDSEELDNPSDSITIVTGCDKTRAWGVASFTKPVETIHGVAVQQGGMSASLGQFTTTHDSVRKRQHPAPGENISNASNHCVFIRGFTLTRRNSFLAILKSTGGYGIHTLAPSSSRRERAPFARFFRSISSKLGSSGTSGTKSSSTSGNVEAADGDFYSDDEQVHHLAIFVNQYLLQQCPEATYAITHDEEVSCLLDKSDERIPTVGVLLSRIESRMQVSRTSKDCVSVAVMSGRRADVLVSPGSPHVDSRHLESLNTTLGTLFAVTASDAQRAQGYSIMVASFISEETTLSTAERVSYFALFLDPPVIALSWRPRLWEVRLRALRALTKDGTQTVGYESAILKLLIEWIHAAFNGLLIRSGNDETDIGLYVLDEYQVLESAEREQDERERTRCARAVAEFLSNLVNGGHLGPRVYDHEIKSVFMFYADLVDAALDKANLVIRVTDQTKLQWKAASLAVELLTTHLQPQLPRLHTEYIDTIVPLFLRSLAFFSSPLPRLTMYSDTNDIQGTERTLTEALRTLFSGHYASTCMAKLRESLSPHKNLAILQQTTILKLLRTSVGAHRMLRIHVRRILTARLAKAHLRKAPPKAPVMPSFSRSNSMSRDSRGMLKSSSRASSFTGPLSPPLPDRKEEQDLIERASKDNGSSWSAGNLGAALAVGVKAWVESDCATERLLTQGREEILTEVAGTLKDVLQELDGREKNRTFEDDEACAVGETLRELVNYMPQVRTMDGSLYVLNLSFDEQENTKTSPLLAAISSLLARDLTTSFEPSLSITLLHIADHLSDADTAKIPVAMSNQNDLSPISPEWLENWRMLLANPTLLSQRRPLTRAAVMDSLLQVYEDVKVMPRYRKPLADLAFEFCKHGANTEDEGAMWRILGDEIVLRVVAMNDGVSPEDRGILSNEEAEMEVVERFLSLLAFVAMESDPDEPSEATTALASSPPSVTPMLSRMQTEFHTTSFADSASSSSINNASSLLTMWTTSFSNSHSRSQSQRQYSHDEPLIEPAPLPTPSPPTIPEKPSTLRAVGAISALVAIFSQLAFTANALVPENLELVGRVYTLLNQLSLIAKATRARLAALQFLMRLRVDRDHRLYFAHRLPDPDGLALALASLIGRDTNAPTMSSVAGRRRPTLLERDTGRTASRGRSSSAAASSRSRSRAAPARSAPLVLKPRDRVWAEPESLLFEQSAIEGVADVPSEGLVSYDPLGPGEQAVLGLSEYLKTIVSILTHEKNWEILSYVLCHLPVQLANKHLFCGPKCRTAIGRMLDIICAGIHRGSDGGLASTIDQWPGMLKPRDAQGLAQQTLSVLVSYRRYFTPKQQHILVEIFHMGLEGHPATVKCCLHALGLCAFELPVSLTKSLTDILEKLSQIMSNPEMAVHILDFLSVVGSLRELHSNFRDEDFNTVFGLALQYLQLYNQSDASPTESWALSQHVRIMAYHLVYVWFLAVRLSDRPRHIPYITRQLILANEGRETVDESTEVCFDWLARYTYASADPRDAASLLDDVLMNGPATKEKTWVVANSVVTIRTLAKRGWFEVVSRRPSGYTKFLCRLENVPMIGPGDVDPDTVSIRAILLMNRYRSKVSVDDSSSREIQELAVEEEDIEVIPRPNPITGYLWSGTAPSQRRKEVEVDPSFFPLQMSGYPEQASAYRIVNDDTTLPRFFRTLDRMPVIDTHKVGIMYVAPGQTDQLEILRNSHGSPAYTRFLEGLGRLINLRGQQDVYAGGLNPDEDGEYAYAWWDDIGQILYHTATMMPTQPNDPQCNNKKRHIGNDYVRIVWNDSGAPYEFGTLSTAFSFVNIVIEPHSVGAIAAFSNDLHENEYFKVVVQRAPGMPEFTPIGNFKLISAEKLPLVVRQLSLLADWFASVFAETKSDTERVEVPTNWQRRLQSIRRFGSKVPIVPVDDLTATEGSMGQQEVLRDFTTSH